MLPFPFLGGKVEGEAGLMLLEIPHGHVTCLQSKGINTFYTLDCLPRCLSIMQPFKMVSPSEKVCLLSMI